MKISEKPEVFWCFQGSIERDQWHEIDKSDGLIVDFEHAFVC